MKEFPYFFNAIRPIDDEHNTSRSEDLSYLKLLEPGRGFIRRLCLYREESTEVMADEIRYPFHSIAALPRQVVPSVAWNVFPGILRVDDVELSEQSGYELLDLAFGCHRFRTERRISTKHSAW